jgi:hypothetical protein
MAIINVLIDSHVFKVKAVIRHTSPERSTKSPIFHTFSTNRMVEALHVGVVGVQISSDSSGPQHSPLDTENVFRTVYGISQPFVAVPAHADGTTR